MITIPEGDLPVFAWNTILSGWMVSVDAAIFMVAVLMLIAKDKRWPVVFMIVLAHAAYGFLGLGLLSLEDNLLNVGLWVVIGATSFVGLRFVIEGLDGDEDGEPADDAKVLNLGVISLAALGLYSGVSIDELFAVLQRYQWMEAQGWDDSVKAANIGLSMIVLFAILGAVKIALEKAVSLEWVEKHGDTMMFVVFSLITYYIVRAVVQNGLGYVPMEIPFTGIAWELLIVGFVLTGLLKFLMEKSNTFKGVLNRVLLLS